MIMDSKPKFRVEKVKGKPVVWILCSECGEDVRQLGLGEEVDVRRGYYCAEHEKNVIVLNPPERNAKDE